jgi:hypothetical protein
MPLDNPKMGAGFVPAYQVSALPFVTSSSTTGVHATNQTHIRFGSVTRWLVVRNIGGKPLKVGFTSNGIAGTGAHSSSFDGQSQTPATGRNYFIVPVSGSTQRLEVRCKELFLTAEEGLTGYSLFAGVTGIHDSIFPDITGSSGFKGVG